MVYLKPVDDVPSFIIGTLAQVTLACLVALALIAYFASKIAPLFRSVTLKKALASSVVTHAFGLSGIKQVLGFARMHGLTVYRSKDAALGKVIHDAEFSVDPMFCYAIYLPNMREHLDSNNRLFFDYEQISSVYTRLGEGLLSADKELRRGF